MGFKDSISNQFKATAGVGQAAVDAIAYDGKKEEKIKLVMAGQNVDRATAEKLVEEFDKEQAKNETGNIISDKLK